MLTRPPVGGMKPVIMRMVVDFPAPLGPRKPSTSPRSTENEIPSTARLEPKNLAKLLTLIIVKDPFLNEMNNSDTQPEPKSKLDSHQVGLGMVNMSKCSIIPTCRETQACVSGIFDDFDPENVQKF